MNPVVFQALDIMWKGMLGIFSVIILITLIVILIQKIEQFNQDFKNKRQISKIEFFCKNSKTPKLLSLNTLPFCINLYTSRNNMLS